MIRGKFITLEGIEGAGKSTIAAALANALQARGISVRQTREPGGTPLAERLRQLVLHRGEESLSAEAETLLMFAARAIHLDNLVRPALERGEWVICDRFTDATRAYQGGGRGVDAALIEQLAVSVHRGLEPDLTVLLDLPVTIGLERARARRQAQGESVIDRFESETVQFFERVRARYLEIARRDSQRCQIIDASADPDSVRAAAMSALQRLGS
ncbi:MAG: dTMP kinase [Gammaproteobacteria bacterium]|jgi:dTMP kinase|nr:dTMP kinase [Gammaproteobacteria bacterium]